MIRSIKFTDVNNTPIKHLSQIDFFKNDKTITLKPYVNIIVGLNGCGKTTLLKLIREYMLCTETIKSECPFNNLDFNFSLFDENRNYALSDGVKINSDYQGVVFNMLEQTNLSKRETFTKNFVNFQAYLGMTSQSTGESITHSLHMLFKEMFNPKTRLNFPIDELIEISNSTNEVLATKIKNLLKYYNENSFTYEDKSEFQYTILMDEPDRNLDISNVNEIYSILNERKDYTQIIAVIHNPILIYKLSQNSDINIIEMTEGYVKQVKDFVDGNINEESNLNSCNQEKHKRDVPLYMQR